MARIDVPFIVNGQSIKQHPKSKLASGGQNYFYAVFDVCNVWNKVEYKKAIFKRDIYSYTVNLEQGDNCLECRIPWEVMTKPGYFDVGIFGDDRITTDYARVFVIEGCMCDGEESRPPTPDWYNNMESLVHTSIPFKVTLSSMGNSSDRTYTEIKEAYDAGRFVYAQAINGDIYPFSHFGINSAIFIKNTVTVGTPNFIVVWEVTVTDEGCTRTLKMLNSLKNPNAITFTGAVNATYDGSQAVSVEIPKGASDMENLVALIETDMLPAVYDANGKILTDENGKIILRY